MTRHRRSVLLGLTTALAMLATLPAHARDFITVASTTSTENSGLFDEILPLFRDATGIDVRVVSLGTGHALETGRRGDADVVFVHDRAQEDAFVSMGYGIQRHDVMYNDFVIVGPADDPADIREMQDATGAMSAIARSGSSFASRGDDSGTHVAEMALWDAARIVPQGPWYLSTGSGMGATLNTAAQVPAYALTDRGTWLSFENHGPLELIFEGDDRLFNPYGIILVSPLRHPHIKAAQGQAFIDWILSAEGQKAIASFTINGEQAFFPGAPQPGE